MRQIGFFRVSVRKNGFFAQRKEKPLTGEDGTGKIEATRSRHGRSSACGETVGRKGGFVCGETRELFLPAGFSADLGRLRHRAWKRMEISVYHG